MRKLKQVERDIPVRTIKTIVVRKRAVPGAPHLARLHYGNEVILAAIGRAGVSCRKHEGDGASPAGTFRLKPVLFRSDRLAPIRTSLRSRPVTRQMGWCDDPGSRRYNLPVLAGSKVRHEKLWREDGVYDVLVPTSHNQQPRVIGAGSAIFLHLARAGYQATEGCVAVSLRDLRRLLPRLSKHAQLAIRT